MNNESLKILSNFTRKLVNYGYRVHPAKIVHALGKGEFGYIVEDERDEVVSNDYVFASDFEALLEHLYAIFKNPKLFLKKENVVSRSEVATKVDNSTLKATYRDEKLWRQKNGEMSPEYLHSFVYEDNYAIYENRFVAYLIDEVFQAVSKKINGLILSVETLNRKMGGDLDSRFTLDEYVDYVSDNLPVLTTDQDATIGVIRSLVETKKKLTLLKNTNVYKDCKKEATFNPKGLKPTNILLKETHYNYCYNFYLNYLNRDPQLKNQQDMYTSFVTVNLMGALANLGFEVGEDNEKIGLTHAGLMRYNEVKFIRAPFEATLSKYAKDEILLSVKEMADGNESKYLFKVLHSSTLASRSGYSDLASYTKDSQSDEMIRTFVVNDIQDIGAFSALYVQPNLASANSVLIRALKSCFMLAKGSSFIHDRYCPTCGSNLLSKRDEYTLCTSCNTKYHVFEYDYTDYVWFKDMPLSCDYKSAEEIAPTVEDTVEVVEELTDEDKLNIVRKSFMQKLGEQSVDTQDYYNIIKHELLCYVGVKSKVSYGHDRFNLGRKTVAKMTVRGKTLCLYLALDPREYEGSKYHVKDVSEINKFADTPLLLKVKSNRGVKYAIELIDKALEGIDRVEIPKKDYIIPQIPAEMLVGSYLKKTFYGKLSQLDDDVKQYYSIIKNKLLGYKKINARLSAGAETFSISRKAKAKFAVRGKTLVLYLALDPKQYENTKYFVKDMSKIKKDEDTPSMIKIKSGRGMKYAIELIEVLLSEVALDDKYQPTDYMPEYRHDAQLLNEGLAKIVKLNLKF